MKRNLTKNGVAHWLAVDLKKLILWESGVTSARAVICCDLVSDLDDATATRAMTKIAVNFISGL